MLVEVVLYQRVVVLEIILFGRHAGQREVPVIVLQVHEEYAIISGNVTK